MSRSAHQTIHSNTQTHASCLAKTKLDVGLVHFGHDLPRQPIPVCYPPALLPLDIAAVAELRPVKIDFLLVIAVDHERDGLVEVEVRPAVETRELLPVHLKLDDEQAAGLLAVVGLAGRGVVLSMRDLRIWKDGDVELGGFFGVAVEPETRGELGDGHDVCCEVDFRLSTGRIRPTTGSAFGQIPQLNQAAVTFSIAHLLDACVLDAARSRTTVGPSLVMAHGIIAPAPPAGLLDVAHLAIVLLATGPALTDELFVFVRGAEAPSNLNNENEEGRYIAAHIDGCEARLGVEGSSRRKRRGVYLTRPIALLMIPRLRGL
ncbi:hypothetical protein HYQ46_009271 [Verticillium longisporum]|nr:hypothetical protein HYQ46_009271 [Verticillium longisporum]